MRHAILSALSLTSLLVASPAFAKTSGDKTAASFSSAIDGVQLSGTVEVPIYDVPGFETVPVVAVQLGETRLFLALEPMADEIVLSGPRVAALGLEGKGKKDGSVASATASACPAEITPPASLIRQMPPSSAGTIRNNPGQAEGRRGAASGRADNGSVKGSPDGIGLGIVKRMVTGAVLCLLWMQA